MNRDELRLELLKLTYSHGRSARDAIDRALELESYVCKPEAQVEFKEVEKSIPEKKSGKSTHSK